jgi:RNA polymerase sigma-70 factor (ECF subfamily)
LFDRYYAPLCRFAEFWLRDRASAEEVVLDVYTHVWQHAAELRITVSVRAYLFRAVRNRALNRLRDDRFSYIPFEELGEVFASPESLQIETDEITQLPGRCRDIFLKSRSEQLSNAEIAAEMHISVKTVEAQMSKALRRLRGLLHKE